MVLAVRSLQESHFDTLTYVSSFCSSATLLSPGMFTWCQSVSMPMDVDAARGFSALSLHAHCLDVRCSRLSHLPLSLLREFLLYFVYENLDTCSAVLNLYFNWSGLPRCLFNLFS